MNIVFMGTPDFAIPSLVQLYESHHAIKAVVTGIDKRRGRGNKRTPTAVKAKAQELKIPVIEVEELGDESFAQKLRQLQPDLIVTVAFRILPPEILAIPSEGAVNLHASLLPKYRGAAPIHWAIINGESTTGCTVFLLDKNVDTGNIVAQSTTKIGANETTGDLYRRLKTQGAELLGTSINQIETGDYEANPQDEEQATAAPKLFTADCKINFNQPARQVHNKIRGLSPFPTAWTTLDGARFNMYRSQLAPDETLDTGKIAHKNGRMLVGCKDGCVELRKVQPEGKQKMSGHDFMNGYHGTGTVE